jgi:repressor LexA
MDSQLRSWAPENDRCNAIGDADYVPTKPDCNRRRESSAKRLHILSIQQLTVVCFLRFLSAQWVKKMLFSLVSLSYAPVSSCALVGKAKLFDIKRLAWHTASLGSIMISISMLRTTELTARQKEVLDFVEDCQRRTGFCPSLQETAEHFGFKSPNSVRQHIRLIEQKGFLRRVRGRSRALVVVRPERQRDSDIVRVPLLGRIPAGIPNIAQEETETVLTLPSQLFSGRRLFALRVHGSSMNDAGILSGDIAILDETSEVVNGAIAAVLIEDEATLKRVYRKSTGVLLKSGNSAFRDIQLTSQDARQTRVIGRLIGVVRKV